ncbi:hypothetical protein MBANPS3_000364 [Mucor bainieri]
MSAWSQNLVALIQWFAPANFVMTFDESCGSMQDIVQKDTNTGDVNGLIFPERIIVTSNHQITVLLFANLKALFSLSDLCRLGLHLVLGLSCQGAWCTENHTQVQSKESTSLWAGMRFFDFIFLQRKLAMDKDTIISNLERSKQGNQSLWLVLFPEGTVVSPTTRKRSKDFAELNDMPKDKLILNLVKHDNRHTLLPRSTGLRLCTTTLADSIDYIYDLTIGYSGIKPNDIPEQVYTIQSVFFFGFYPKQVHVYVRRFKVDSIPTTNEAEFNQWNLERWKEKDDLMDHFYKHGVFPSSNPAAANTNDGRVIDVPIRLNSSVFNLAQIWVFIVPYLWVLKKFSAYITAMFNK